MISVTVNQRIAGGHGDLLLDLKPIGFSQVADTYYFALDTAFMEKDESEDKVVLSLRHLLKCWFAAVSKLDRASVAYLPFDFSDQYIGCLRVEECEEENLMVSYGSTRKFEGSSFNPFDCDMFILSDKDYSKTTGAFICHKSIILASIKNSIDSI